MDFCVLYEFCRPLACSLDRVVHAVGQLVAPLPHLVGVGLAPFEFVDIEEIEVREGRDEQLKPGKGRDFDADIKALLLCHVLRRR